MAGVPVKFRTICTAELKTYSVEIVPTCSNILPLKNELDGRMQQIDRIKILCILLCSGVYSPPIGLWGG